MRTKLLLAILIGFNLFGYAQERPNIIWLMAEDISTDIECYGMSGVKTPNLNKLAEEGIKFTNAICTNSICSPSRSAMLTGVIQSKINAHHHRSNHDVPLNKPYQPFTKILRDNGYTCILGSNLVMDNGRKIDVNFKHSALGEWNGTDSFGLFDKYDEISKDDQPFFAQIQLKVTHRGDWWDEIRNKSEHPVHPDSVVLPPYMADHPVIRMDWAKYLDQIEYMDKEIGTVISDLKDKGLYDNTVIIFIGDNGRCNIRGKGYLFDSALHIPFILSWKKGLPQGKIKDELISTIDITTTILDIAGIKIPDYMDGKSVLKNNFERDFVYSARDLWDEIMEKSRSITTKEYKYIKHYRPELPFDAYQAYLEFYRPAVHIMRKLKWQGKLNEDEQYFFQNIKPEEELYDISEDPHELKNLAKNPAYKTIKNTLNRTLLKAESEAASLENVYNPVIPTSVEIYNWVKYEHPDAYQEMLNGKEIGFIKYNKLFSNLKYEKE
jgi:N-sulfoglucosamine sulfohydrolase